MEINNILEINSYKRKARILNTSALVLIIAFLTSSLGYLLWQDYTISGGQLDIRLLLLYSGIILLDIIFIIISFLSDSRIIKEFIRGIELEDIEESLQRKYEFYRSAIKSLSLSINITCPDLIVVDTPGIISVSLSLLDQEPVIAINKDIFQIDLNKDEITALAAEILAHVISNDVKRPLSMKSITPFLFLPAVLFASFSISLAPAGNNNYGLYALIIGFVITITAYVYLLRLADKLLTNNYLLMDDIAIAMTDDATSYQTMLMAVKGRELFYEPLPLRTYLSISKNKNKEIVLRLKKPEITIEDRLKYIGQKH